MTPILAGLIWRGARSRPALTYTMFALTVLALASAALGPLFAQAVTHSYTVDRLNEAPNSQTGISQLYRPDSGATLGNTESGLRLANYLDERDPQAPLLPTTVQWETPRFVSSALGGEVVMLAKNDACLHLQLEGNCPTSSRQALMLAADAEFTNISRGDLLNLGDYGQVTIVGTYAIPTDEDYWFNLTRLATSPPFSNETVSRPYQPAPLIVPTDYFEGLPSTQVRIRADRQLKLPLGWTQQDLSSAELAATIAERRSQLEARDTGGLDGQLVPGPLGDLPALVDEVAAERGTARTAVTPAVVSLILVSLALLWRLSSAASRSRLGDLSLAGLRGVTGGRRWTLALAEPLAVLALAAPFGAIAGWLLGWLLTRLWLVPNLPVPWPSLATGAMAVVWLCAVGVVVAGVASVLRLDLSGQLTSVTRPRAEFRKGTGQLIVVVVGVVVVTFAATSRSNKLTTVDLLVPVALALAGGIMVTWLLTSLAQWWVQRQRSRSLAAYVAWRGLARRDESTLLALPIVAAVAVAIFAYGVFDAAAQWRGSVAATIAPGATVWSSPYPMSKTVAIVEEVDPAAEHATPISRVVNGGLDIVTVDADRLAAGTAWNSQWTVESSEEIGSQLAPGAAEAPFSGDSVELELANETGSEISVGVKYVDRDGQAHTAFLGPYAAGTSKNTAELIRCAPCELVGVTIGGPAITGLELNGVLTLQPPAIGTKAVPQWSAWQLKQDIVFSGIADADGDLLRLDIDSAGRSVTVPLLPPGNPSGGIPAVVGEDDASRVTIGEAQTIDVQGNEVLTTGVAVSRSLPFLGPTGVMVDYRQLAAQVTIFADSEQAYVLTDADSPTAVHAGLSAQGLTPIDALSQQQRLLGKGAFALALRLYEVVAALVALLALVGLGVSIAISMPARRRDAASLRAVGVTRGVVARAAALETGGVMVLAGITGLAAGLLAQLLVLRGITLGIVSSIRTPHVVTGISPERLIGLTALLVLVLGSVAITSAWWIVRGARGASLREQNV